MNYEAIKVLKSTLFLICILIAVVVLATNMPIFIENEYSVNFYVAVSRSQRFVTGFLPFCVGELLYAGYLLLWIVIGYDVVKARKDKSLKMKDFWLESAYNLRVIVWIIISFYVLWGFNYSRLGITHQLEIVEKPYQKAELEQLTASLVKKMNATRKHIDIKKFDKRYSVDMFTTVAQAYEDAYLEHDFLEYENPTIKKSIVGKLLSKLSISGYYNPFSGEAVVNANQPGFLIPYTAAHEVAHQIGYASEDEASFLAFLATTYSQDTILNYSTNFEIFSYANRELAYLDSAKARKNYEKLDTLIKADFVELRRYNKKNRSILGKASNAIFDGFLQVNNQADGIQSYNKVVGLIIAYKKRKPNLY